MSATIKSLHKGPGGVPKAAIDRATVTVDGIEGDWQQDRKHHGGPERALCLYSHELIDALAAEGHPIYAGSTGENIVIEGLQWALLEEGCTLSLGDAVRIEITREAVPCKTIAHCFLEGEIKRILQKKNPGWSRMYARVLQGGELRPGDAVVLERPAKKKDE